MIQFKTAWLGFKSHFSRSSESLILFINCLILLFFYTGILHSSAQSHTSVQIKGEHFFINNEITLKGITLNGSSLEGMLPNSRMVQGIFDDLNPETRKFWKYPDTGIWDPDRNTNEFVAAIPEWRSHGLLAFTLNIQGGSPTGYGNKSWVNPGFEKDGQPIPEYFNRLERILNKADESGMVVILGIFYFGQDEHLRDETAVKNAVTNTVDWLLAKGYRNVMIEIDNECNSNSYDHEILKPDRIHELIELVKNRKDSKSGYRLYVSTSYGGRHIPHPNVVQSADFLLLHGNGVEDPAQITRMVEDTRKVAGYHPMPILFNEDDHYNFDKPVNNMIAALKSGASWGFFDLRKSGETLTPGDSTFKEGYQSIPVDWGIHSRRKIEFFDCLSALCLKAQQQYGTVKDIHYYSDPIKEKDEYLAAQCTLDLYYPKDAKDFPTIVWFHGGGLTGGKKQIPEALMNKGYAVVGVEYRLSPKANAPAYIEDAAAAVAWVFSHINDYGGNKSLIFISGHSAGGYLGMMITLDKEYLGKYNIDANSIAALIPFSGQAITHFTVRKEKGIRDTQPTIDKYAPLYFVRADAPPMLLITGDREQELLGRYEENAYLLRMMKLTGHTRTTLFELQGFNHGGMAEPAFPLLLKEVASVTKEVLEKKK